MFVEIELWASMNFYRYPNLYISVTKYTIHQMGNTDLQGTLLV